VAVEFRTITGASGVVGDTGFKACLPAAAPAPALSLGPIDRIETSAGLVPHPSPDLRAIEGREGHTLRRHVGLGDDALRDRALRTHHDVSCFDSLAAAQQAVDEAFAENQGPIGAWMSSSRTPNLALHVQAERTLGRVFRYDSGRIETTSEAEVVLEHCPKLTEGYTVITAYPVPAA
jgi:hypothetical protein